MLILCQSFSQTLSSGRKYIKHYLPSGSSPSLGGQNHKYLRCKVTEAYIKFYRFWLTEALWEHLNRCGKMKNSGTAVPSPGSRFREAGSPSRREAQHTTVAQRKRAAPVECACYVSEPEAVSADGLWGCHMTSLRSREETQSHVVGQWTNRNLRSG